MSIREAQAPYGPIGGAVVDWLWIPYHLDNAASYAPSLGGAGHDRLPGRVHSLLGSLRHVGHFATPWCEYGGVVGREGLSFASVYLDRSILSDWYRAR